MKYPKSSKQILNRKHRLLIWFWNTVEKLTPFEKRLFCRFLGRTTRPNWDRITISYQPIDASEDENDILPSSPSPCCLLLPHYSSEDVLLKQLRIAIHSVRYNSNST